MCEDNKEQRQILGAIENCIKKMVKKVWYLHQNILWPWLKLNNAKLLLIITSSILSGQRRLFHFPDFAPNFPFCVILHLT